MYLKLSILILFFLAAGCFALSCFYGDTTPSTGDYLLPAADNAIIYRFTGENRNDKKNATHSFYNYSGDTETAFRQLETGQTFPGLDEDSAFVREIKAKPVAKAYTEYGYVPPVILQKDGDVKGNTKLKRPDGRTVKCMVIDYKGQLYDGETGFPCFLCADSMQELGIKVPYM